MSRASAGIAVPWWKAVSPRTAGLCVAGLAVVVIAAYFFPDARLPLLTLIAGAAASAVVFAKSAPDRDGNAAVAVEVEVANGISPTRARGVLLGAVRDLDGVCGDAATACGIARLKSSGVTYRISFSLRADADADDITSRALTRVWHAMQREGWVAAAAAADSSSIALTAIDAAPLFVSLPAEVRREMAAGAELELWDTGECVVEQDAVADSCFIVRRGRLGVHVSNGDAETQIATLHAGDLFGEMSLLTGQNRWATVRTEEDTELVRIRAAALKTALTRSPELVQLLAESVATRRDHLLAARFSLEQETPATLPDDIRRFLEVSRERAQP